jgi:hypothetical protein
MNGILVDTCVILDIVERDPRWLNWSLGALEKTATEGALFINPIIYAELSIGYHTIEETERVAVAFGFRWLELPREALFLAGKAFLRYRRQRGVKTTALPNFFIGAHAAVTGIPLLTRDTRRVRHHFPTVRLISPPSEAGAPPA